MLYCNNCGQCIHISPDEFIQILNTSGWEKRYIDSDSEDSGDFIDGETTDSEIDETQCPHCNSNNVEYGWEGTQEEAEAERIEYEEKGRAKREKIEMEKTGWDL